MTANGNGTSEPNLKMDPADAGRVATLAANAIRASNDGAIKQALDFADASDRMAADLVEMAQSILDVVKDSTDEIRAHVRARAVDLSNELRVLCTVLEANTTAYVERCGQATTAFEEQTRLLASPPKKLGPVGNRGESGDMAEDPMFAEVGEPGERGETGPMCPAGVEGDPTERVDAALARLQADLGVPTPPVDIKGALLSNKIEFGK